VIENRHRDGILRCSEAPPPRISKGIQHVAEMHARAVMDALDYTGVVTIELFQRGQELLGNEMAPRVHNSGHLTIEACATSQFANHIRAITGAPLGSTRLVGRAVMHNVIGHFPDMDELLSIPDAHVHLYGKGPREGRKLGHVTLLQDGPDALAAASERVEALLGP
jgi:5-(carboxyamino)imidazole ribonucleotide synthase